MIVTFAAEGSTKSGTADLQMSIKESGRFEVWSDALVKDYALIFMPQDGARYQEWFSAVAEAIGYGERAAVFRNDTSIRLVFGGGFSAEIHANGECFIGSEPFRVASQESI